MTTKFDDQGGKPSVVSAPLRGPLPPRSQLAATRRAQGRTPSGQIKKAMGGPSRPPTCPPRSTAYGRGAARCYTPQTIPNRSDAAPARPIVPCKSRTLASSSTATSGAFDHGAT